MPRFFVYGTLRRGESNHHLMRGASYLGDTRTAPGFALYDYGPYPGMVAESDGVVAGELYDVDPTMIPALDHLEGHPDFYRRQGIRLESGDEVLTYLLRPDQVTGLPRIPSGDWRHR